MHVVADHTPEVLDRAEAERFLRLKPGTLNALAVRGRGPSYARTGDVRGRTLYRKADLLRWLETRTVTPAGERR